jgi:hypothetical protein
MSEGGFFRGHIRFRQHEIREADLTKLWEGGHTNTIILHHTPKKKASLAALHLLYARCNISTAGGAAGFGRPCSETPPHSELQLSSLFFTSRAPHSTELVTTVGFCRDWELLCCFSFLFPLFLPICLGKRKKTGGGLPPPFKNTSGLCRSQIQTGDFILS